MAREGLVVRYLSDVRRFGSGVDLSDFRTLSVVRWLMVVGRPALVGRPEPGSRRTSGPSQTSGRCSFGQLLLLVLVLGVLAVLSMVFLLVPGHA